MAIIPYYKGYLKGRNFGGNLIWWCAKNNNLNLIWWFLENRQVRQIFFPSNIRSLAISIKK